MARKYWQGGNPAVTGDATCDSCNTVQKFNFIDGRTSSGIWAILCVSCHTFDGCGLGPGKGQKYARQIDNRWLKIEG